MIHVIVNFSKFLSLKLSDICGNKSANACIIMKTSHNYANSAEASVYFCYYNVLLFVEILGIIYDVQ